MLAIGAALVFVVLWVGCVIGITTGGSLFSEAWAWLTGLPPVVAVVAWIAFLPIAVGLWAWSADLGPLASGLVLLGLAGWTLLAASGLRRSFRETV